MMTPRGAGIAGIAHPSDNAIGDEGMSALAKATADKDGRGALAL